MSRPAVAVAAKPRPWHERFPLTSGIAFVAVCSAVYVGMLYSQLLMR